MPQNPNFKSEPSLNNRAAETASPIILNPPLGARPIPIQAQRDRENTNMFLIAKVAHLERKLTDISAVVKDGIRLVAA